MKNILLALVLLATPTFAIGDHFVDANLGDDTTGAGTIAAPWKTISHALAQFHATGEVVHIAAGTYDAALGESFPMDLRPGISLVGAGMQSTTIDGGSASAVIEFLAVPFSVSAASSDSVIENLHIAGLRNGIRISNDFSVGILFVPNPTLRNLKVSAQNRAVSIFGGTKAFTTIVGCEIGPSKIGIHATFFDGFGDIEVTDTKILNCETGYRVSADSGDPFATVATYIRRCEILGCTNGVQLTASNINVPVYIEDSLIADGVNGIVAPPPGGGFGGAYISRTTITGNSNYGVTTNDWENIG